MHLKRQNTAALQNVALAPSAGRLRACVLECGAAAPPSRGDWFLIQARLAI